MWEKGESLRDFVRVLIHGRPEPGVTRRPTIDRNFQSNVPGLYIVGDLAGAPLLKTAINQGVHVIRHLNRPEAKRESRFIGASRPGVAASRPRGSPRG